MKNMNFTAKRILVTGASSGLGLEMARQLAYLHKANLVLVARRHDRLAELQLELEQNAGVQCQIIAADLSQTAEVERVYAEAVLAGDIYGVILNAGVTHFGKHMDLSWPAFEAMLATNVSSVVRMVNLFVPYLLQRRQHGGIMLISSMAGFLPVPYQSAYAGTKAFITNFTQSLQQELRDDKVSLTLFAPGGIDTSMTQNSKLKFFENTAFLQDVQSCAHDALLSMQQRKAIYVPGKLNQAQLFASRFAPRNLAAFITQSVYKKALSNS